MTQLRLPIVGQRHHKWASEISGALPVSAKLSAIADPNNSYDPNAIQVWIETKDIPQSTWTALASAGLPVSEIADESAHMIGFIAAAFAAELRHVYQFPPDGTIVGKYAVGSNGGHRILLETGDWN